MQIKTDYDSVRERPDFPDKGSSGFNELRSVRIFCSFERHERPSLDINAHKLQGGMSWLGSAGLPVSFRPRIHSRWSVQIKQPALGPSHSSHEKGLINVQEMRKEEKKEKERMDGINGDWGFVV